MYMVGLVPHPYNRGWQAVGSSFQCYFWDYYVFHCRLYRYIQQLGGGGWLYPMATWVSLKGQTIMRSISYNFLMGPHTRRKCWSLCPFPQLYQSLFSIPYPWVYPLFMAWSYHWKICLNCQEQFLPCPQFPLWSQVFPNSLQMYIVVTPYHSFRHPQPRSDRPFW